VEERTGGRMSEWVEGGWQPVRLRIPSDLDHVVFERLESLKEMKGKIIYVRPIAPVSDCGSKCERSFEIRTEDCFDTMDCICEHQIEAD
jgi:hypothetical protein